jgi:hypothetical protein
MALFSFVPHALQNLDQIAGMVAGGWFKANDTLIKPIVQNFGEGIAKAYGNSFLGPTKTIPDNILPIANKAMGAVRGIGDAAAMALEAIGLGKIAKIAGNGAKNLISKGPEIPTDQVARLIQQTPEAVKNLSPKQLAKMATLNGPQV